MPLEALTSAEISLPPKPDALRVRERIAALADSVDLVALTDNHAGESQMTFDVTALTTFLDRAAGLLHDVRFYAGLGLLRNERMADRARELPGCVLPDAAHRRIVLGDGLRLAKELARELAGIAAVDA